MDPGYAIEEAFKVEAPASIIAICTHSAHSKVERMIAKYARYDLLDYLEKDVHFMLDEEALYISALEFDSLEILHYAKARLAFKRDFWKFAFPFFDGDGRHLIPIRILECLTRCRFFDDKQRDIILEWILASAWSASPIIEHVPAFEKRLLVLCRLLKSGNRFPAKEELADLDVIETETDLSKRISNAVWGT